MNEKEFRLYANNLRGNLKQDENYLKLERYAREAPQEETRKGFQDCIERMIKREMGKKEYQAITKAIEKMDYLIYTPNNMTEQPNIYQTI